MGFDHLAARRLRIEAGLKGEQVAIDLDRTKETLVAWEMGRVEPSPTQIAKLCKLYNCQPNDLISLDD